MSGDRILVVDDEPQIQRFLRPALTAAGYDVVEAGTGSEDLRQIAVSAPDVVMWGPALLDDLHYLRVFVAQVRAKIEREATLPKIIRTEPGVGYRFMADENDL